MADGAHGTVDNLATRDRFVRFLRAGARVRAVHSAASASRPPLRRPGVPARPPFAFTAAAPLGWDALRGDAPSLRDDLVALVARSAVWPELTERRRRGVAEVLGAVARVSAATGAVATLLHVGPAPSPQPGAPGQVPDDVPPEVSSITLTWLRTAPLLADLDLARLVVQDGEPVGTGIGPGVVARRTEPTPTGAEQVTSQIAAPVPGSIWLAVLTGTTSAVEHAPAMDDALLAFAQSLRVDRPTPVDRPAPSRSSGTTGAHGPTGAADPT